MYSNLDGWPDFVVTPIPDTSFRLQLFVNLQNGSFGQVNLGGNVVGFISVGDWNKELRFASPPFCLFFFFCLSLTPGCLYH